MNTFSVNSLKLLDKNSEEFIDKYILHLDFLSSDINAKRGERLHNMISYYLRNFDIEKIKNSMTLDEKKLLEKTLALEIFKEKEKFIKSEEPFLIKCKIKNTNFYLTGRFDAIFYDNNKYIIYDWKSKILPKDPQNDLQSVVYLYCASKIFNTQKITIKYVSLETHNTAQAKFQDEDSYFGKIISIIQKLPQRYLT